MNQVNSTTQKSTHKSAKGSATRSKANARFTDEERAAMKARARELKASADEAESESAVVAKIAEMAEPDRLLAERIHAIIKASAPDLKPRLWYGMPA